MNRCNIKWLTSLLDFFYDHIVLGDTVMSTGEQLSTPIFTLPIITESFEDKKIKYLLIISTLCRTASDHVNHVYNIPWCDWHHCICSITILKTFHP